MKKLLALVFIISFVAAMIQAQTFPLSGQVKTSGGAGIYNAQVHLFSNDCSGVFNTTVQTSPFGYYTAYIPNACLSLSVVASHKSYIFSTPRIYIFDPPPPTSITGADFTAD